MEWYTTHTRTRQNNGKQTGRGDRFKLAGPCRRAGWRMQCNEVNKKWTGPAGQQANGPGPAPRSYSYACMQDKQAARAGPPTLAEPLAVALALDAVPPAHAPREALRPAHALAVPVAHAGAHEPVALRQAVPPAPAPSLREKTSRAVPSPGNKQVSPCMLMLGLATLMTSLNYPRRRGAAGRRRGRTRPRGVRR